MNLDHYKAASEATDADERALIPGFKRVNWPCKCNLCGATAHASTIAEASQWAVDHGCNYGKPWDEQAERNRDLEHESRETEEREASGYWDCNEGDSARE